MILAQAKAPEIDWAALSPVVALTAGACIVLENSLVYPQQIPRK